MLVDSHCHLDFPDFASELDAVVDRARAAGVRRMVTISTRVRKLDGLLAIAERYEDVFCSVGTHPHHAHEELDISAADLVVMADNIKIVAIGEAGLDYFYDNSPREAQAQGFRAHIAAARETHRELEADQREEHRGDEDDDPCCRHGRPAAQSSLSAAWFSSARSRTKSSPASTTTWWIRPVKANGSS